MKNSLKKQLLLLFVLGTWLGLAWGMIAAAQEIASHRSFEYGLWRLALWQVQEALDQAWPEAFFCMLPLALLQIGLLARCTLRLSLAFLWTLPTTLLLSVWLYNDLQFELDWQTPPNPFSVISILCALGIAALGTLRCAAMTTAPDNKTDHITRVSVIVFLLPIPLHLGLLLDHHIHPPKGPNVLLIVVDSLRPDHMSVYGYTEKTTPYLEQFAQDTITFQNAFSTAPWTTPSISTMLSSHYPRGHVWPPRPFILPNTKLMLPELFLDNNYDTAGFVAHSYVAGHIGFSQGFKTYDDSEAQGHRHISGTTIAQKAIAFLDQTQKKPFFLFLHYFDPHYDYFEHARYRFFPDYLGKVESGQSIRDLQNSAPRMSSDDLRFVRALYDSEIRFTDDNIRLVLEHLKKLDLYENTLIVLVADHGEEFSERGDFYIGHIKHSYQQLIHVPLLIKFPHQSAPQVEEHPVSLIDLAPTIAHYAQLSPANPPSFQGQVIQFSDQKVTQASPIFSESRVQLAHVSWPWKLILNSEKKTHELYNLQTDPYELHNLADREPQIALQLTQEIVRFSQKYPVDVDTKSATPASFSPEEIEQLKAMGYVE